MTIKQGREHHIGMLLSEETVKQTTGAELFKAGLDSARFEFRFESLKSISVLMLFVYKLMIGSSKNNRENYPRKCFLTQEKETGVKLNRGLSGNRFSNNWAQGAL